MSKIKFSFILLFVFQILLFPRANAGKEGQTEGKGGIESSKMESRAMSLSLTREICSHVPAKMANAHAALTKNFCCDYRLVACANLTILPKKEQVILVLSIQHRVVVNKIIPMKNPPPVCSKTFSKFKFRICVEIRNTTIAHYIYTGCVHMVLYYHEKTKLHDFQFKCFHIPIPHQHILPSFPMLDISEESNISYDSDDTDTYDGDLNESSIDMDDDDDDDGLEK